MIIFGKHPVFSAIKNNYKNIKNIYVSDRSFLQLKNYISQNNLKFEQNLVKIKSYKFIDNLVGIGAIHQGFLVETSVDSQHFLDENNFISSLTKKSKISKNQLPNIVILDQLSDPHNIGAIIRSCVAFGVEFVVLTKHHSPKDSPIIQKSSAGTLDMAQIIISKNINDLMAKLKKLGYWCIGLDSHSKTDIKKIKDYQPVALVMGNEGKGIRTLVKKNCDVLLKIPMKDEVESLNVSNAAAICLYEIF